MPGDPRSAIPHRPPFLLLDEIVEESDHFVLARAVPRPEDELWSRIYAGHYPGNPITPGALLCEMLFQAAAIMTGRLAVELGLSGVPMVTRIQEAKFKSAVFPGDELLVQAELVERLANAFFMKGRVQKNGRTAMEAKFSVALANSRPISAPRLTRQMGDISPNG
ncbi:MAG: beta-hydroxyacyl-ACP dehydratase [Planctomycetota bacterium]|jgi:3-hydroxyacyl-[acyl-carrier-protein] dehydratase|nr:beta-hydroxyacyl-ACP dehydratase [Planctomycetota bacterium]